MRSAHAAVVSQGARTALATAPPLEQLKAGAETPLQRAWAAGRLAGEPALPFSGGEGLMSAHELSCEPQARLCTFVIQGSL